MRGMFLTIIFFFENHFALKLMKNYPVSQGEVNDTFFDYYCTTCSDPSLSLHHSSDFDYQILMQVCIYSSVYVINSQKSHVFVCGIQDFAPIVENIRKDKKSCGAKSGPPSPATSVKIKKLFSDKVQPSLFYLGWI